MKANSAEAEGVGFFPPSSGGRPCSLENFSAEKPLCSDSASTSAPRKMGQRRKPRPGSSCSHFCSRTAMPPTWRRTATTKDFGLRIITPSMTACPPMYGCLGNVCDSLLTRQLLT